MDIVKGFFDYCIEEECIKNNYEKTIKTLYDFGYRTIAINQKIDEGNLEPKKKKKKSEPRGDVDIVPEPIDIKKLEDYGELKILNRLTIVFANQDAIHKIIRSPHYKKYHLIAVLPTSQQAFQFTCSNIEADIFCFDPESSSHCKIVRKTYNQLVEKGFHFEILYTPAIVNSTQRKNTIQVSHTYHSYGKSRNIIVSSGATNPFLIRSPYDIINLGLIFGLSEEQSKNAITHCCRNVYVNAVGRRHAKAVVLVENIVNESSNVNEEEADDNCDEMDTTQPAQKKIKSED